MAMFVDHSKEPSYRHAGGRSVDLVEGIELSTGLVVCPLWMEYEEYILGG